MASTNTSPIGTSDPVISVTTSDLQAPEPSNASPDAAQLYPTGSPNPRGTLSTPEKDSSRENSPDPGTGSGVDGELSVWEARYSKRNFIGRVGMRVLLTAAAGWLAYHVWHDGHTEYVVPAWAGIGLVAVLWATLIWRMIQAHYSHYYRLTNRRLFVSTGVISRRRDMMELMRVKDVFTRQQSLMERWLKLGTVVVVSTEKELPTFYLAGVDDPKEVMDLIWHHARAERDHRSVKVDSV